MQKRYGWCKMNDFNLPALSIKPLTRISPSRFYASQLCHLREILVASGQPALLPVPPAARIGSVVHTIIEMATGGKIHNETQFNETWQKEISKIEESMNSNPLECHLVPLEETAADYEVKKFMVLQTISSFVSDGRRYDPQKGRGRPEVWLETKDGKIGGKIDLIKETPEGTVIIDYKTGSIIDAQHDEPKEEYQQQLKLYAGLFFENFNKWPQKLLLVGIDQSVHEVIFSQAECIRLLEQAKKYISDTNELISSGISANDFAAPSPEACRYCLFRPGCYKYWQARQDTEDWPIDVIGHIREKGFAGNNLGRLVIEADEKRYTVRALSLRHILLNGTYKNALICNLGNDTSPGYYIERLLTTSYGF